MVLVTAAAALAFLGGVARGDVVFSQEQTEEQGFVWRGNASDSHGLLTVKPADVPDEFDWCNHPDGKSYCTMSRNQHIPQYCGSCWAHGAVSALADRVKIARKAQGVDINLAVQHVLNCNGGGSCNGGSIDGVYQWLHRLSKKNEGISFETSNPYMACSSDSKEGLCTSSAESWTCTPMNVARTCSTFRNNGGHCSEITPYPNVQIDDYGSIRGAEAMQKEIFARGPISCGIDAGPMLNYTSGIFKGKGRGVDHVVSVVGWANDPADGDYWIVRNSWGEYWGMSGYIYLAFGSLNLESQCSWATPSYYTALELGNQVHCYEGGENCLVHDSKDDISPVA